MFTDISIPYTKVYKDIYGYLCLIILPILLRIIHYIYKYIYK